jgi:hypothetical protein
LPVVKLVDEGKISDAKESPQDFPKLDWNAKDLIGLWHGTSYLHVAALATTNCL